MRVWELTWCAVVCASLLAATGCGSDGNYQVAKVSGQLLCDGQPVPNVYIGLTPLAAPESGRPEGFAGKGASAITAEDGTFVLTTYKEGDGALTGRHQVRLEVQGMPESPEEWQGLPPEDEQRFKNLRDMPCALRPDTEEVTIEPGSNELTINLQSK